MNATIKQAPEQDDTFLALVDFKWLMAGLGWWVDLSRLRRDMAYAGACAQRGLASGSNLVRQRSVELLPLLARDMGVPHPIERRLVLTTLPSTAPTEEMP